ncbi:MAG: extracellular solute-binding protein [Candidatus Zipacnadales bacterium]
MSLADYLVRRLPSLYPAILLLAVSACSLFLTGCPRPADDGSITIVVREANEGAASMNYEDIVKAARVEKNLEWYTSLPEDAARTFMAAFRRKYDFIDPHLHRAGTFETITNIKKEIDSGEMRADVLHVLDVGVFIELRSQGELLRYPSPEGAAIDQRFCDPNYWWAMRLVAIGMAYNRKILPPHQVPVTWEDLLRPEFTGKIAFKDAGTAGTAYAEYYLLRERFGTIFWERMAKQRPRIHRSVDEVLNDLLNGNVLLAGEMAGYAVLQAQKEGLPIEAIWPKEGVPLIPGPVAILARAPHPNAAKLFVDFALSQEGQKLFRDALMAYSARADVGPLKGQPPLFSLKLLTPTSGWEEYLAKQTTLRSEFGNLFRQGEE